jgi:hypothetical protein
MKNSKLIEMLRTLEPKETSRFRDFIHSPYFNKSNSLSKFVDMVLDQSPHYRDAAIQKKEFYKSLYPGKAYQEQTMIKLMKLSVRALEQFLAYESYSNKEYEQLLYTMEAFRVRGLNTEFVAIGKKLEKKLETGTKDFQMLNYNLRYEEEMENYELLNKEHRNATLERRNNAFEIYFLSAKMKLACDVLTRQNVYGTKINIILLDEILEYIKNKKETYSDIPTICIYYYAVLTLLYPNEEKHYFELKTHLRNSNHKLSGFELKEMYATTQNYCIRKINSGYIHFLRESLELSKEMINSGVIYDNGLISQWDYKNITSAALRLGEYDWANIFIETHKNRIHSSFKEVAYSYNLAYYYFEKKDYTKALKMLNKFNEAVKRVSDPLFEDIYYQIDSRALILKIYFELEENDLFYAVVDSLKLFIKRTKKISANQKATYNNLIDFSKKLNQLREKFRVKTNKNIMLDGLKSKINSEKNITNLTWLQSQVEKLEQEMKS